jgi:SOS response regulatory protein OraA/RecX
MKREAKNYRVLFELTQKGYIDGTRIREITGTTSARDYIYDLKRRHKVKTVAHHLTPTHTRWLLAEPKSKYKPLLSGLRKQASIVR